MKIADFNELPLMSRVLYDGKRYVMVDRLRKTHEAVIVRERIGTRHTVRCSEIKMIKA